MKTLKRLTLLGIVLSGVCVHAQTNNYPVNTAPPAQPVSYPYLNDYTSGTDKRNYVRSFIPGKPTTNTADLSVVFQAQQNNPCVTTTRYFDGLGRPLQEVFRSGGSGNTDIVQVHTYDDAGREAVQYLSYPLSDLFTFDHGKLKVNPLSQLSAAYNLLYPGQQPYSLNEYDNSLLDQIEKSYAPGASWVGNGEGTTYIQRVNELYEDVRMWVIGNSSNSIPQSPAPYDPGTLNVVDVLGVDGQRAIRYTDKSGKVVLEKKLLIDMRTPHSSFSNTYYVYDDMNRLRYVVTPNAVQEALGTNWQLNFLTKYCYRYWYDEQGRLIEKQVPDKEPEYFVYDRKDRLVLSQDGNMRRNGTNTWMFTSYDGLNRPLTLGVYNAPNGMGQQQLAAMLSTPGSSYSSSNVLFYLYNIDLDGAYPGALYNGEARIYNYYDDYSQFSAYNFDNSFNNLLTGAGSSGYALPTEPTSNTRGLLTGIRVKVMDPSNNNLFITTTNYYDKDSHLIQVHSDNLQGGEDITTNQYDFQGTVVSSVLRHTVSPSFDPAHITMTIVKKFTKDYLTGKVIKEEQNLGDGFKPVFSNTFDGLGRLSLKTQGGNAKNRYSYNIQGWLTGINEGNLENPTSPDFFHEKLSYDAGFSKSMLSGNISGIMWRGNGNTAPVRYYSYDYDKLNRMTGADFGEHAPGSAINSWSNSVNDFAVSGLSYDINGNLLSMNQRGPGTSGPVNMDQLSYQYEANSNQLINVTDNGMASTAPDFHDGNTGGTRDYEYDPNGNLEIDRNKNITTPITYSSLNKPEHIAVSGSGTIDYLYDALGNKLRKTVTDAGGAVTTTEYMGSFVYENNKLQYVLHEEGRSRPDPAVANGWLHDYFIKDHLGNVRSVVNMKETDLPYFYQAGLEVGHALSEGLVWSHLDEVRDDSPDMKPGDVKAALLDGTADRQIGTAIMLRVMPGDKFKIEGDSWYESVNNESPLSGAQLASSLIGALTGGSLYGGTPVAELPENVALINQAFGTDQFATAYDNLMAQNYDPEKPSAYLNYVIFDDNLNVQDGSKALQAGGAPDSWFANESNGYIEIGQPGYIAVWTANKGTSKVYYDKLAVTFYKGSVLEENHYYPFGLTLSSATTNPAEENRYKLTTKELQPEFGLNTYDFGPRNFDMQTGRWYGIDPHVEKYAHMSPYAYCNNNPALFNDPTGKDGRVSINGNNIAISTTIYVMGNNAQQHVNELNQYVKDNPGLYKGTHKEGDVTYNIQVNTTYALAPDEMQKTKQPGEGNNIMQFHEMGFEKGKDGKPRARPSVTNVGPHQIRDEKGNFLKNTTEHYTGNYAKMNASDPWMSSPQTGSHEGFHMLGLSDRYDNNTQLAYPGFGADKMGASGANQLIQVHWDNWGKFILRQGTNNFILNQIVDKNEKGWINQ